MAPLASGLMLAAATAWGLTLPAPGDADGFHAGVLAASADAPRDVAVYRGRDEVVAKEAVELLRPNLILSRSFTPADPAAAAEAGLSPWAQLLIVQCRDARDILGHWPPVCYVANGYSAGPVEETTWSLADRQLPGRLYHFHREDAHGVRSAIVVANFLVLPDGRVVRDMEQVTEAGGDYRIRYYGAAQVQILTPEGITAETRRRTEQAFLEAHAGLIRAMAEGVAPAPTAP